MRLNKLSEEEEKWLISNFNITKSDIPELLGDVSDILGSLTGKFDIRLHDYKGNSNSFYDDCVQSIEFNYANLLKLKKIRDHINKLNEQSNLEHCDWDNLFMNLWLFAEAIYDGIYEYELMISEMAVYDLLKETGIT